MPSIIDEQLKAIGVAQVLVVLKSPPPPSAGASRGVAAGGVALTAAAASAPSLAGMENYFTQSELSQGHALAMAGLSNVSAGFSASTRSAAPTRRGKTAPAVLHFPNLGVMLGTVNRQGLAGLRADERVESVSGTQQPSLIRPVKVAAATLTTKTTWGIEFLQVPRLWQQGLTGKGIRVGHLDTGVDGKHPALKAAIASFAEFDSLGSQIKPVPKPHDTGEHGSHTAATIAGRAVKNQAVGVAPEAMLASAIVIEGGDVVARILGGMDWAITQDVRVLSMSLGLRGLLEFFLPVTQIIRARNILPVFAVGNEGIATSRSPGNYVEALSVGANDSAGRVADFSSSQRFLRNTDPLVPDLVAPGVDVISAKPGGGFQLMSGSSMATPHVAGLAALLFQAKPTASVAEVENAIFGSCTLGSVTPARGNRGVPNAVRALAALTGTVLGATKGTAVKPGKKAGKKVAAKKPGKGKSKAGTKKSSKK
ncbi:MAG TPA: S8 family serine peptidase [Pyrinomonadaceae bacterium]|jgi:subtilisin family serine protease|nr:S8 family serine peptidase [Pyrinomonadaceae bacterium]